MAAVVRLKRRLEEEPLEAFVLTCKKKKPNNASEEKLELTTVLKFAGTIKEDENVLTHLKKQRVAEIQDLKDQFKKRSANISEKLRVQTQENSKNSRYRVINCFRTKNLEDCSSNDNPELKNTNSEYRIFDIQTDLNDNDATTENHNGESSKPKYVYDLYYTNSDDFGDAEIEDYVSVRLLNDPLIVGSNRDNGVNTSDTEDDSEDSNAESNWRNDYPDESDMESINEDDMVDAMKNVDIGEDLLSSDEGEEGFVYSIDSDAVGFEEDIDESDVLRYGERYARFKAKNKKVVENSGLDHDFYYGDIDEEEYYY